MQSPIREQLRVNDRWHARQLTNNAARIFVPGPWAERRVVLTPETGTTWSAARIAEQSLDQDPQTGDWEAAASLEPGQWNSVATEGGEVAGAQLTASSVLHISSLEATVLSDRCLSVRVRLAGHEQQPSAPQQLLTLYFTLTSPDGSELGGMDVTIAPKSRGLSIEMPLPHSIAGIYRLKASLCCDETVIDNARITLDV